MAQNLAKVKFVEVGEIEIKQQKLPGMGTVDKVPFSREYSAGSMPLPMAIDAAMGMIPHIYKKNKLQVMVSNSKQNRWEVYFEEEGTGKENYDVYIDAPEEGAEPGEKKVSKKDKDLAEKKVVEINNKTAHN